jgi:serine/threonine protein kinase
MIGSVLNERYRVLSKLGEGGMGEVYLAEHINLQRKEALKILRPSLADDPQFVSRFRREARATNRVQHPNIVSVYDFGQLPDGRFYLSMEYAEGQRLDLLLREIGALPLPRVLNILHQLAEAVEHAHGLGVVHCDLKPENLILVEHRRRSDILKVLDFGIAKMSVHEREDQPAGQVLGTPHYMAPEQVGGQSIDERADLYAIGCIAFELATGQTVFSGGTVDVINAQLRSPADPPSRRHGMSALPPEFDALVLRCLQKDPEQRFQDGRELRLAIERIPGFFETTRSSSKRKFNSHLRMQTFETDDTDHGTMDDMPGRKRKIRSQPLEDAAAFVNSPTLGIDRDELRAAQRQALLELVEGLLDIGHEDVQLLIGASRLKELGDELSRNEQESAQLETRTAEVEQSTRERESSLRFALGEMVFARAQAQSAAQAPPPDLEQQIALLEKRLGRLSEDLERTLTQLTERAIALAAARADIQEQMASECAPLELLVDEVLPRYEQSPAIRPAAVAWRTLRPL